MATGIPELAVGLPLRRSWLGSGWLLFLLFIPLRVIALGHDVLALFQSVE